MMSYPTITDDKNPTMKSALDYISRVRQNDIQDWNSLPNTYIAGRKVAKVPTASTDITGSFPGDFNVTASFAYFCVNNSGTVEWVRVAVGTF